MAEILDYLRNRAESEAPAPGEIPDEEALEIILGGEGE